MISDGYSGTCSYKFDVSEKGQLRLIGGVFYQSMDGFKEQLVAPIPTNPFGWNGIGRLTLEADGWGWRSGVAYEIPEYSLRASLVYNSEVKLDEITGTLNLNGLQELAAIRSQAVHGMLMAPPNFHSPLN